MATYQSVGEIKADEFYRKYIYRHPEHERFGADIFSALVKYYAKNPEGVPTVKVTEAGWMCMVEVV